MAPNLNLYSLLPIVVSFFSIYLSTFTVIEASNGGFSVDFIHRDSTYSPFYNPSETPTQRLNNAIHRSFTRIDHFKSASISPKASGEYLMNISIGTPPVKILGIVDTCSDLIWTQCMPCESCYKQISPIFNPFNSSSFRKVSCKSKLCEYIDGAPCNGVCKYRYNYGDELSTIGDLATDNLALGSTVALKKIAFGCGHYNKGIFNKHVSGIIGLGRGQLSLFSQLGSSVDGKFSYCLVPLNSNSTSKLNFGSLAEVSGQGMLSTPIFTDDVPSTIYYISLEGISVGNKRLESSTGKGKASSSAPNMMIDSGTTLTVVPSSLYEELETALKKSINLKPVSDPQNLLKLCYRTKTDINVPIITLHFTGADVNLQPLNTFVRVQDDLVCLAMVPTNYFAILGNLAQMNFWIGYDIVNKKISFQPTDCTKQ